MTRSDSAVGLTTALASIPREEFEARLAARRERLSDPREARLGKGSPRVHRFSDSSRADALARSLAAAESRRLASLARVADVVDT